MFNKYFFILLNNKFFKKIFKIKIYNKMIYIRRFKNYI